MHAEVSLISTSCRFAVRKEPRCACHVHGPYRAYLDQMNVLVVRVAFMFVAMLLLVLCFFFRHLVSLKYENADTFIT